MEARVAPAKTMAQPRNWVAVTRTNPCEQTATAWCEQTRSALARAEEQPSADHGDGRAGDHQDRRAHRSPRRAAGDLRRGDRGHRRRGMPGRITSVAGLVGGASGERGSWWLPDRQCRGRRRRGRGRQVQHGLFGRAGGLRGVAITTYRNITSGSVMKTTNQKRTASTSAAWVIGL
jgi:hypothetical protein